MAGVCAKTAVSPFERVRILAQTRPAGGSLNPIHLGKEVIQAEGLVGFWRGNGANILRVFPSRGILFWSNDRFKTLLGAERTEKRGRFQNSKSFAAGAMAGITACFSTYPLDLARTRITSQVANAGPDAAKYVTVRGTVLTVVRNEGLWALYRGMGPTLMGALPYEGIKFGCYDMLRRNVPQSWFPNQIIWQLSCGAIAGTAAGMVMYPNDTVRRLMQVQSTRGSDRRYANTFVCYREILREYGLRRFYRGLSSYLVRMVPNAAIQFSAFEFFKSTLPRE